MSGLKEKMNSVFSFEVRETNLKLWATQCSRQYSAALHTAAALPVLGN